MLAIRLPYSSPASAKTSGPLAQPARKPATCSGPRPIRPKFVSAARRSAIRRRRRSSSPRGIRKERLARSPIVGDA